MTTLPVPNLISPSPLRPAMKNNYQIIVRSALLALALTAAVALNATAIAQAPPGSLWYNGDFNYVNGLANGRNFAFTQAAVYDDFNVTAPLGWNVTAVFSDDLTSPSGNYIFGADWEIRTGVSEGNAGTLIASGTTNSPLVTLTGRGGFGLAEYMVEVTGLNVFLPMLPSGQHYWLNVTPVGNGTSGSYNSTTSGTNCVGTPCGNDGNSWFNSTYFGVFFGPASAQVGVSPADFSDGVIGTVVPEPATVALLACGLGALLIASRRRRAICWTLSASVICLSSTPQTRGQTLGNEIPMGAGFEPVVSCDRRVDPPGRIQFVWMDNPAMTIYWAISHDLGAHWDTSCGFSNIGYETRLDPLAACDNWSTDTSRRMYFGWFTEISNDPQNPFGDYFRRSLSGGSGGTNCDTDVDNPARMENG
jgi:hypothetical protein